MVCITNCHCELSINHFIDFSFSSPSLLVENSSSQKFKDETVNDHYLQGNVIDNNSPPPINNPTHHDEQLNPVSQAEVSQNHHEEEKLREDNSFTSQGERKKMLFSKIIDFFIRQMERELLKERRLVIHETPTRPRIEVDLGKTVQNIRSARMLLSNSRNSIDQRAITVKPLTKVAIALAATAVVNHHINSLKFAVISNFARKALLPTSTNNGVHGLQQMKPLFLTNAFNPGSNNCHSCHDHHQKHHDSQHTEYDKQESNNNLAISNELTQGEVTETSIDPKKFLQQIISNKKKNSFLFDGKKLEKSATIMSYEEVKPFLKDPLDINGTTTNDLPDLPVIYISGDLKKSNFNQIKSTVKETESESSINEIVDNENKIKSSQSKDRSENDINSNTNSLISMFGFPDQTYWKKS